MQKKQILEQLEKIVFEQYESRAGDMTVLQLEAVEWCVHHVRGLIAIEEQEDRDTFR